MQTPILVTERLLLRPLQLSDAEEVYRNWATDPEVARYMTWSPHENVEVTRRWLTGVEENLESDTAYDWGFERKEDHKLIGSGGIYYNKEREMFSLGYNIMKSCWRQGYTTEAVASILRFATKELQQDRLYAFHAKDNPNSGKVMEKVGFFYIGDTEYTCMDGRHVEAKEYLYKRGDNSGDEKI